MSTVNDQIVDSVSDVVALNSSVAPAHSIGMLDTVMTETLGMAMYNAVNRQQGAGMISSAAVTAACAKMIAAHLAPAVPKPPAPVPPPTIEPLRTPPPNGEFADIASALAEAESAISVLKEEAAKPESAASNLALTGLSSIAADATLSEYGLVATALAEAETAIAALKEQAGDPAAPASGLAAGSLAQIAQDAHAAQPPPLSPPAAEAPASPPDEDTHAPEAEMNLEITARAVTSAKTAPKS
ncbi:MAG: hypothetical protein QOJ94_2310 [Sphingomonadales bacterium]|jgi:hypothetical protein|nr:hypothetical protein [Sphingomonadales bacterium]